MAEEVQTPSSHSLPPLPKGQTYDDTGKAVFHFPPFPDPPPGVQIIPFKDFKPNGIQVTFGLDDEVERDGLGIPTKRLPKMHDNENLPSKKRKLMKILANGKQANQPKAQWWEDWEAGEEQRIRSAPTFDANLHQLDRLAQVVEEFQKVHPLDQNKELALKSWWEKFLYFIGLLDIAIKPRRRRPQDEDEEEEEGYSDPDTPANPQPDITPPTAPDPETNAAKRRSSDSKARNDSLLESDESFLARVTRQRFGKETRQQAFLNDAVTSTKIFFTSYFYDKGWFPELPALRRLPRLVAFFLAYVIGTRALPEHNDELREALKVARKAIVELPLILSLGRGLPDKLASCLSETFGAQVAQQSWGVRDEEEVAAQETEVNSIEEKVAEKVDEALSAGWGSPSGAGWTMDLDGNDWGSSVDTAWNDLGGANPDTLPNAQDWSLPVYDLKEFLGETTLPETHRIGYVEESVRWIGGVTLPAGGNGIAKFAKLELKPYKNFADPSSPHATIQPPALIKDPSSTSDSAAVPKHDPFGDTIMTRLDPILAKEVQDANVKGIGLRGIFVQLVPLNAEAAKIEENGGTFWYAEKIHQVIPSFWTEKQE